MKIRKRSGPKTDPLVHRIKLGIDLRLGHLILWLTAPREPRVDPLMGEPSYPIKIKFM